MARFEKNFGGDGQAPLSLNALLTLLDHGAIGTQSRQDAIACYLAGGDGWREAVEQLDGAFAVPAKGLSERKDD